MIKSITLVYRKEEITHEEFNRHLKEQHAPLVAKSMPGLRRYVHNYFVEMPGKEYDGDGIIEMWYDDIESYQKAMNFLNSPAGKPLIEDGAKFVSASRKSKVWLVQEHVVKDTILEAEKRDNQWLK